MQRPILKWTETFKKPIDLIDDCRAMVQAIMEFQKTMIGKVMIEKENQPGIADQD